MSLENPSLGPGIRLSIGKVPLGGSTHHYRPSHQETRCASCYIVLSEMEGTTRELG